MFVTMAKNKTTKQKRGLMTTSTETMIANTSKSSFVCLKFECISDRQAYCKTLLARIAIAAGIALMVSKGGSLIAVGVLGSLFAPHAVLLAASCHLVHAAALHVITAVSSGSFYGLATGGLYGFVATSGLKAAMDEAFFANKL